MSTQSHCPLVTLILRTRHFASEDTISRLMDLCQRKMSCSNVNERLIDQCREWNVLGQSERNILFADKVFSLGYNFRIARSIP